MSKNARIHTVLTVGLIEKPERKTGARATSIKCLAKSAASIVIVAAALGMILNIVGLVGSVGYEEATRGLKSHRGRGSRVSAKGHQPQTKETEAKGKETCQDSQSVRYAARRLPPSCPMLGAQTATCVWIAPAQRWRILTSLSALIKCERFTVKANTTNRSGSQVYNSPSIRLE